MVLLLPFILAFRVTLLTTMTLLLALVLMRKAVYGLFASALIAVSQQDQLVGSLTVMAADGNVSAMAMEIMQFIAG